jgi:hypothetical protein
LHDASHGYELWDFKRVYTSTLHHHCAGLQCRGQRVPQGLTTARVQLLVVPYFTIDGMVGVFLLKGMVVVVALALSAQAQVGPLQNAD